MGGWRRGVSRKCTERAALNHREPDRLPPQEAGALYLELSERLWAFAVGLLGDHELAREVVQTTFGKALESAGRIPPEARKAWLYRVAYHEAMLLRRRQGVAERVQKKLLERQAAAAVSTTPDDDLVRWEEVRQVREALLQLPESQQVVVRKRIYEGKTFAQIAAELGIPLGTVLTRMRLALGRLERVLQEPEGTG